jgi:hypothetical protein
MRSFSRQIKAPAQDQDGIDLGFVDKGGEKDRASRE